MADTKIRISAETAQAQAALKSLGTSITGLSGNLVSFSGMLGGALSVGVFANFIKSSIDLQNSLGDLSKKTGITASDLGGLKFAAEQNGTSLEMVAKGVKELSINMTAVPEKFAKLGINAKDATGALVQIADLIETMPDGMQKTALLAELMGKKVGPEMAEFLSQGGASLREYIAKGQQVYKVTDESAAKAKEYKDRMAELDARMSGVGVAISSRLLPGLTEAAKGMSEAAEKGNLLLVVWEALAGMSKVPWDLLKPPEDLKTSLKAANRIKELKDELRDLEAYMKRTSGRGDGLIGKWLHGSSEENVKRISDLKIEIGTLEKYGEAAEKAFGNKDKDKPKTTPKSVTDLLNADQKNGLEVLRSLERDYQNELAKRKDALNAPLLSASEKQLAEDLRQVHKRAQDARVAIEKQNLDAALAATRMAEITAEEQKQTQAVKDLQAAQDKLNASWEYGARKALASYVDDTKNTSKAVESLVTNAFKGMEDALVQFVTTGKLDFKSLTDSILADLARIAVQKSITGPLANALGSMFSGGYGDTAGVAAGVPRYEGGGFTGMGSRSGGIDGKGGFMAVMHPNETVIDHMRGQGIGGGSTSVVVHNYGQDRATVNETTDDRGNRRIEVVVGEMVSSELARPGSSMHTTMRNSFGAQPAMVRR